MRPTPAVPGSCSLSSLLSSMMSICEPFIAYYTETPSMDCGRGVLSKSNPNRPPWCIREVSSHAHHHGGRKLTMSSERPRWGWRKTRGERSGPEPTEGAGRDAREASDEELMQRLAAGG